MTAQSPVVAGSALERLTSWCRSTKGLDARGIAKFFRFLQPAPDLRLLSHVVSGFQAVRPLCLEADPELWQQPEVDAFLALCRQLDQDPAVLAGLEPAPPGRSEPLLGIVKLHPVYCLLTLDPTDSPVSGDPARLVAFRRLQAYVFNAMRESFALEQAKLDRFGSDLAPFHQLQSQIAGAELWTRKIIRGHCPPAVLDLVPGDMSSLGRFHEKLSARAEEAVAGPSRDFATRLDHLFSVVLGQRRVKAGGDTSESAEHSGHHEATTTEIGWENEALTAHRPARHARQFANIGISVADATQLDITYHSGESVQVSLGDSPSLALRRSRGKLRALARRNQHLPITFERLTVFEVHRLYEEITNLINGQSRFRPNSDGPSPEALAAFLGLALWTGTPYEVVLATRVLGTGRRPSWESNKLRIGYLDPISCLWWPPRQVPGDAKQAEKDWLSKRLVAPVVGRLALPLPPVIWPWLDAWLSALGTPLKGGRTQPLFGQALASPLKEEANRFLRYIRKSDARSRLRLSHIDVVMFHRVAEATSDSVDAALITGRMPIGVESALYYYAPEVSRLQEAYTDATDWLLEDLLQVSGETKPRNGEVRLPTQKARRIGSQIFPELEFLRAAVKEQIAKVKASGARLRRRPVIDHWVSYHNDLTSYCVLQLGYATGLRAIHDPFPTLDDFDPRSGLMVVADKIKEHSASTRVVYLPELCRQQLEQYLIHLQRLAEHLVLLGKPYAAGLMADSPGRRGRNLPRGHPRSRLKLRDSAWSQRQFFTDETPPLFFFLTELAERWEPVGAAALSAHLGATYPIPPNSNRHYLRTRLRELGVSGEVVDAFMGHGSLGQEPFGRFSNMAPLQFLIATEPAIRRLLNEVGWKVLPVDPPRRSP